MKKIAVILSGCGYLDGAEITEAISTLVAIGQEGAEYKCFAPNKDAVETNHLTQKPTGQNRNVLQEAARIARGEIQSLEDLKIQDFDALAFPGGFGAALHLCDFAQKGSGGNVDSEVLRIVKEFHDSKKDINDLEFHDCKDLLEMAEIINMPRLSDTMEEGTVAKWFKKVGDKVNEGDILAEIETDKATMEFESFYQGELLHIGLEEGQSAAVDSLLAIIGKTGTDINKIISSLNNNKNSISESSQLISPEIKDNPEQNLTVVEQESKPQLIETKVNSNGRIIASPLAKKLAEEKGINLNSVKGSGEFGRIIKIRF